MKQKTVMVIDGGGRGSVLVEKYSLSRHVGKILAVPGNDLMQENSKKPVKTYPHVSVIDKDEILKICLREKVDLVDVAQDNAVEAGVADILEKNDIAVVGPTKLAGQIEWDKAWSREFMLRHGLPIPKFKVFSSQKDGISFIKKQKEEKWFIKANGLVEGKGALPANDKSEAVSRIKEMSRFGKRGTTYIVEDWLVGEEFSLFAICDGETYQIAGLAQDYKRMYNQDLGENTGGMGCSSPVSLISKKKLREMEINIIKRTVDGLRKEGRPFKGILYFGGMVVGGKVYTIEFNARWGDPEAEVLIPGIQNDFFELGLAVASGTLSKIKLKLDSKSRVSVALTPGVSSSHSEIYGIESAMNVRGVRVYNSRVMKIGKKYFAQSGRQLHIMGEGENIIEARSRAYAAVAQIFMKGNGLHYRTDIGWREVERYFEKR